jgi:hypothetical protein
VIKDVCPGSADEEEDEHYDVDIPGATMYLPLQEVESTSMGGNKTEVVLIVDDE